MCKLVNFNIFHIISFDTVFPMRKDEKNWSFVFLISHLYCITLANHTIVRNLREKKNHTLVPFLVLYSVKKGINNDQYLIKQNSNFFLYQLSNSCFQFFFFLQKRKMLCSVACCITKSNISSFERNKTQHNTHRPNKGKKKIQIQCALRFFVFISLLEYQQIWTKEFVFFFPI